MFSVLYRVPTSSGNNGKPGKSRKKVPCMEKSWNLKRPWIIMENHWILWNNLTKPPVTRKLAVRHTHCVCLTASFLATDGLCVWQLVFWLLVVSSFNQFKMHSCLTADPGVASSIPARYHTFVEIDHEIISTVILLPSADLFKKGCCQLQAKVCAQITG